MIHPFDVAEDAFEAASLAHKETPSIQVKEMPTSALIAELVSYLTPSMERERETFIWGSKHKNDEIKERQDAVVVEIDRRMPR